jgi:hypothetical protein
MDVLYLAEEHHGRTVEEKKTCCARSGSEA